MGRAPERRTVLEIMSRTRKDKLWTPDVRRLQTERPTNGSGLVNRWRPAANAPELLVVNRRLTASGRRLN